MQNIVINKNNQGDGGSLVIHDWKPQTLILKSQKY